MKVMAIKKANKFRIEVSFNSELSLAPLPESAADV